MKRKETGISGAIKEFSRFAKVYDRYNIIQSEVANTLVSKLSEKNYGTIIDIGAGSGKVYHSLLSEHISFERFIALDSSLEMLNIHPNEQSVEKICADFNCLETFDPLEKNENTLLLSSSALQWSTDPEATFSKLSQLAPRAYFAIFTSNTFKTLHQCAGIDSPIHNTERLKAVVERYYDAKYELRQYKLHFDSVHEMFRYIKKSGVSGGEKKLGYKETKALMKSYPLDYLEFEVLFVEAKSR
ncbi:methyltransferase domain-containing protein [Sulfurovum sp. NBC37-1]|uniref:methyltransferase domain-containing protein n=1 Tax=Sulfurovum sp. (strain NBC37-1) TaxID=387093 RepID=UPI000158773D|nr:methyltransferase domain-containing protein [Sulfurovum sp. NBC37-1]BAF70999.1 methyl transferase [Sulfurovum sp. NBC37-1]